MTIPPQMGAGRVPLGSATRIMWSGTVTKAMRDRDSSPAERRMTSSATHVSCAVRQLDEMLRANGLSTRLVTLSVKSSVVDYTNSFSPKLHSAGP